jgi:hypothetical protein
VYVCFVSLEDGNLFFIYLFNSNRLVMDERNTLVFPVVQAHATAVSYSPTSAIVDDAYPLAVCFLSLSRDSKVVTSAWQMGRRIVLLGALQARNGARVLATGSLWSLSDEAFGDFTSANKQVLLQKSSFVLFCGIALLTLQIQVVYAAVAWMAQRTGVLRFSQVKVHGGQATARQHENLVRFLCQTRIFYLLACLLPMMTIKGRIRGPTIGRCYIPHETVSFRRNPESDGSLVFSSFVSLLFLFSQSGFTHALLFSA